MNWYIGPILQALAILYFYNCVRTGCKKKSHRNGLLIAITVSTGLCALAGGLA